MCEARIRWPPCEIGVVGAAVHRRRLVRHPQRGIGVGEADQPVPACPATPHSSPSADRRDELLPQFPCRVEAPGFGAPQHHRPARLRAPATYARERGGVRRIVRPLRLGQRRQRCGTRLQLRQAARHVAREAGEQAALEAGEGGECADIGGPRQREGLVREGAGLRDLDDSAAGGRAATGASPAPPRRRRPAPSGRAPPRTAPPPSATRRPPAPARPLAAATAGRARRPPAGSGTRPRPGRGCGVAASASATRRWMRPPAQRRHPLVERLADQRVGEPDPVAVRRLDQQARLHPLLDHRQHRVLVATAATVAQTSSGTSWPITAATASSRCASAVQPRDAARRSPAAAAAARATCARSPSCQPSVRPAAARPASSSARSSSPTKSAFPSARAVRDRRRAARPPHPAGGSAR